MRKIRKYNGTRGAVDLPSIMVGIIVLGILGSIVAVSVFAVVPWAQDKTAQQEASSIHTAQETFVGTKTNTDAMSLYQVLTPMTNDSGLLQYANLKDLLDKDLLNSVTLKDGSDTVSSDGRICVIGGEGTYQTWVASKSGHHTYYTSTTIAGLPVNEKDNDYVAPDVNGSCLGFNDVTTESPNTPDSVPADGNDQQPTVNNGTDGIPLTFDLNNPIQVVSGDVAVESHLNNDLSGDTSHTYIAVIMKNVGSASNQFVLKLNQSKIPYNVKGITVNDSRATTYQENGEWYIKWDANQYNQWPTNGQLDVALDYNLKTIDTSHVSITQENVNGNQWYATQKFVIKNESNYAANWNVTIDLSDLQNLNTGKTLSAQDSRYTITRVEGNKYQVSNNSENYALPANGSRDVIVKLG